MPTIARARTVAREVFDLPSLWEALAASLDIVELAQDAGEPVEAVGAVYFALGDHLQLHWRRDQIVGLPRENRWQTLARAALRDDIYGQERALTAAVLRVSPPGDAADARIETWPADHEDRRTADLGLRSPGCSVDGSGLPNREAGSSMDRARCLRDPALSGRWFRSWWIAPFKLSHERDHMLPGGMAVLRVLVSGHVLLRFM